MSEALLTPDLPAAVAAEHSSLHIPSRPEWIAPTVEYLGQKAILCGACSESRADRLMLALREALTNSVVHGSLELSSDLKDQGDTVFAEALAARAADPHFAGRVVQIETHYDGERCCWMLTDQGLGFDVQAALRRADEPPDEEALLRPGGRGLIMMRALLDEVHYEAGGRRVLLTLYRSSGKERRQRPRVPLHAPLRVAPVRADGSVDWDAATDGVARNLSVDGIGILQARLAAAPWVLIAMDWKGHVLYLPAEVRHCQAIGKDAVEIGCCFRTNPAAGTDPATPSEAEVRQAVGAVLERLAGRESAWDERRAHQRATYTARIGLSGGPPSEPSVGFGRDLSRGGVAFLTAGPLALEPRVLLLPHEDGPPLPVRARILRCDAVLEGVFSVAAQFLGLEGG
jgi:anti-sigma regulatory factor (Ser/Thr protein kinase)